MVLFIPVQELVERGERAFEEGWSSVEGLQQTQSRGCEANTGREALATSTQLPEDGRGVNRGGHVLVPNDAVVTNRPGQVTQVSPAFPPERAVAESRR